MTQWSLFFINRTKYFSKPQAFTKVTYHGFFKCEGKCYPNTQLELCWKMLLFPTQFQLSVGVTFSLTLEKAMVGDLGKSLWLREIFGSVYKEKRPLCHIRFVNITSNMIK